MKMIRLMICEEQKTVLQLYSEFFFCSTRGMQSHYGYVGDKEYILNRTTSNPLDNFAVTDVIV